jgi:hypothetical protein
MLNKKLVLGSLAGATLLLGAVVLAPSSAVAAVTGTCHDCHTMHNMEEGAAVDASGPYGYLLNANGCVGCHMTGTNDTLTGVDPANHNAPQVDNTGANMLAGGYFVDAGTPANMHDVAEVNTAANLLTAPSGDVATTFTFVEGGADFGCTDCHGAPDHHGGGLASYRFLNPNTDNAGTLGGVVTAGTTPSTIYGVNGDYGADNYNAVAMNTFCAGCHAGFHGAANTGAGTPFTRHPTGAEADATAKYAFTGSVVTPIGETGATYVMCISCHRPHGSAEADLLRFTYADQQAGNVLGDATGCEGCHGAK